MGKNEVNTIVLSNSIIRRIRRSLRDSYGINELQRIQEGKQEPFRVYNTFGNFWAVEYQGLAKVHLTLKALNEELLFLRKAVCAGRLDDIQGECLKRGWRKMTESDYFALLLMTIPQQLTTNHNQ